MNYSYMHSYYAGNPSLTMDQPISMYEVSPPQSALVFAGGANGGLRVIMTISNDGELKFGEGVHPKEAAEAIMAEWKKLREGA